MVIDDNAVKVVTLMLATISTLGLAFIGFLTLQANNHAAEAAREARSTASAATAATTIVRDTLAAEATKRAAAALEVKNALEANQATTDSIHTLVNGSSIAQLGISSAALTRIAQLTNDPEDKRIAEQAQALYQAQIDRQAATTLAAPPAAAA